MKNVKKIVGMAVICLSILLLCGNTLFASANIAEVEVEMITVDPTRAIISAVAALVFGIICVAWRHRKKTEE